MKKQRAIIEESVPALELNITACTDKDKRINCLLQKHISLQCEAAKELGRYYTVTNTEAKTVSIYQNDKLIETLAYMDFNANSAILN